MSTPESYIPTDRTTVRRVARRADYDQSTVLGIIDASYLCQVAFSVDGQPHCIPTAQWRIGDTLYIHGSNGSRLLRTIGEGAQVCVCVAMVDGLVLARSAFHHSMNYRSAMIYGTFRRVTDDDEKWAAMEAFMEKLSPGRWPKTRQPDNNEMAATTFLAMKIDEAVAKVRTGPPLDDEVDLHVPAWAGVKPIVTSFGESIQDFSHLIDA